MKTSQKILLTASAVMVVSMIASMLVIRNDIQALFVKKAAEDQYKVVAIDKFESIRFSANWIVSIKQGSEYKVEVALDSMAFKPIIKLVDGTLHFSVDTLQSSENPGELKVRITTPFLREIQSVNGTRIHLSDFRSDSLTISIEDGCVFTGNDNKFKYLSFKSTGGARIELTETPDF